MGLKTTKLDSRWVTLKCDPSTKEDDKTQFLIKSLTVFEMAAIEGRNSYLSPKDGRAYFDSGYQNIEAVMAGLKDVKNLTDTNGAEIKIKLEKKKAGGVEVERVTKEFIEMLPAIVIVELAGLIHDASTLDEVVKEDLGSTNQ
jgi:hypothetical protein